jgi:hypothetical protein
MHLEPTVQIFIFRIWNFWLSGENAVHSVPSRTLIGLLSSCLVSSYVDLSNIFFLYLVSKAIYISECYHFVRMVLLIWLCDRYFLVNDKHEKIEEQTGTVRTNCIDCLDRTNVTQVLTNKLYHIDAYFIIFLFIK